MAFGLLELEHEFFHNEIELLVEGVVDELELFVPLLHVGLGDAVRVLFSQIRYEAVFPARVFLL